MVDFEGRADRVEATPSSMDRDRGGGRRGNDPPCPPDPLGIAYLAALLNFQRNRSAPSRCRPSGRFAVESPRRRRRRRRSNVSRFSGSAAVALLVAQGEP